MSVWTQPQFSGGEQDLGAVLSRLVLSESVTMAMDYRGIYFFSSSPLSWVVSVCHLPQAQQFMLGSLHPGPGQYETSLPEDCHKLGVGGAKLLEDHP